MFSTSSGILDEVCSTNVTISPGKSKLFALAVWLTALWDGLQYQWLYDRSSVAVAAQLTAHLDDVLPRAAR